MVLGRTFNLLIDFDSSTLLILGISAWLVLVYANKRRPSAWPRRVCLALFSLYLISVAKYVFFPIPVGGGMRDAFQQQSTFLQDVNLVPFSFNTSTYLTSVQAYGNVLLAVPFGFAMPFLWRTSWRRVVRWALGFGLTVEGIQLAISLALGFPYRTLDVNDLLFNFVGVGIGYVGFLGFARVFPTLAEKAGLDTLQLVNYLAHRCARPDEAPETAERNPAAA